MGSLEVNGVRFHLPSGQMLLDDVSFRVGRGDHVALVGANGTGKTTLLRLIVGEVQPVAGSVAIDGRALLLPQLVGDDEQTVRELMVSLSSLPVRAAAAELAAAETAAVDDPGDTTGMRLARTHAAWADVGGYEAEVLWDVCSTAALEQFGGTVIAVTHDRWLMRSFDRFLVFGSDCTVRESPEPLYR